MKELFFIAQRYIIARKKMRAINIITWISILGTVIGTISICVILSVLNGFRELSVDLFQVVDSRVQVISPYKNYTVISLDAITDLKEKGKSLFEVQEFYQEKVLLSNEITMQLAVLKAVPFSKLTAIKHSFAIKENTLDTFSQQEIILGQGVLQKLDIVIFSTLSLFSSQELDKKLSSLSFSPLFSTQTKPIEVNVKNTFISHPIYDNSYALTSLRVGGKILQVAPNSYSGFDILCSESNQEKTITILTTWLEKYSLQNSLQIRTLEEKHQALFQIMQIEKLFTFITLLFIIIIASVGLIGSLSMTAIEKKKELYYLYCLGVGYNQIGKIFLLQGTIIGVIGAMIGIAIGYTICMLQKNYGLITLPYSDSFIIRSYPVVIKGSDFMITFVSVLCITILSSVYPAIYTKNILKNNVH